VAGRRGHNEDAVLHLSGRAGPVPVTLLAVADGMGGHAHGEVASRLACAAFEEAWADFLEALRHALPLGEAAPCMRSFLTERFSEADRRIGGHEGGGSGMGTTLTVALLVGGGVVFASVGDSRAYLVRRDDLTQVTEDHSAVADAVRRGGMTEAEAEQSGYRHALTRSLDGTGDAMPDLFPPGEGLYDLGGGAVVLVCSDGLHGPLTELDLFEGVLRTPDVVTGCRVLAAAALEAGSADNVSVAVAEHGRLPRAQDPLPVDDDRLAAVLGEGAGDEAVGHRGPRLTASRALAVAGVLLLVAAGELYALSRPAPAPHLLAITPGGPTPDSLRWTIEHGGSEQYGFVVSFAPAEAPADTVRIPTRRHALALTAVAEARWAPLVAGLYRWGDLALVERAQLLRADA